MAEYNRVEQLKQLHKARCSATDAKANEAIDYLLKNKKNINFNKVSELSGISVATLYKHAAIRQRIEFLRSKLKTLPSPKEAKGNMSDESKDAVIASLKRKIKRLEEENRILKEINQSRLSSEFDKL